MPAPSSVGLLSRDCHVHNSQVLVRETSVFEQFVINSKCCFFEELITMKKISHRRCASHHPVAHSFYEIAGLKGTKTHTHTHSYIYIYIDVYVELCLYMHTHILNPLKAQYFSEG